MVSTNVFAEWTAVSESANGIATVYVDFETIKKKGNKVKIWDLLDLKTAQKFENDRYLSTIQRMEYDCEEETGRTLDYYLYSGNMRNGEIVYSSKNIKDEPKSILPGSIDEGLFKIACYKK
jgi:hypothetical protein